MRFRTMLVVGAVLALVVASDAWAQQGRRGGRGQFGQNVTYIGLLRVEKVREAINVTEEQQQKIQEAGQELAELAVLEEYLPKALTEAEIEVMATEVIAQIGVTSQKEFGKVMGPLMARIAGRADGKVATAVVRRLLPA